MYLKLRYFKRGDVAWQACSLDLSICDYFIWGYLKCTVFIIKPNNINEHKTSIQEEIRAIPNNMVQKIRATVYNSV